MGDNGGWKAESSILQSKLPVGFWILLSMDMCVCLACEWASSPLFRSAIDKSVCKECSILTKIDLKKEMKCQQSRGGMR
jgi:hypothetical protein